MQTMQTKANDANIQPKAIQEKEGQGEGSRERGQGLSDRGCERVGRGVLRQEVAFRGHTRETCCTHTRSLAGIHNTL